MCKIDDYFIKLWHPLYDTTENDEQEYQEITIVVEKEVSEIGTITKPTFIRILEWKAARLKGIVKLNEYDMYAEAIRAAIESPEEYKLTKLTILYGVGVPLASTILHFIYPENFPIMDIRTAEVLHRDCYIESVRRDEKNYHPFRSVILRIKQQYPQWSLRQIDRALFAYHKKSNNMCTSSQKYLASTSLSGSSFKETNNKKPKAVMNISIKKYIQRFQKRRDSGNYESLTDNQQKLYAVTREMSQDNKKKPLKKEDIIQNFRRTYPNERDFESKWNMLTDFCYNKVNKDDKPNKFLFSERRSEFVFVDFDWESDQETVDVFWDIKGFGKSFKVGYYKNKGFVWDFHELMECFGDYAAN